MKIGIFDSGIGGLSVLSEAISAISFGEFIYYADTDNVPYGEKSEEEIRGYVEKAVDFLIEKGARAIVLACNTATSVSVKSLREKYSLPIVGMEPAVKRAVDLFSEGRVLVSATPMTIKGEKLHSLIGRLDSKSRVDLVALPGLVRLAEKGVFEGEEVKEYLDRELSGIDLSLYSSFVLGCTHFVFYKKALGEYLPSGIKLLDGNEGTVRQLLKRIKEESGADDARQSVEYFTSGRKADEKTAERYSYLVKLAANQRR